MFFYGSAKAKLDEKNRVRLPSKYDEIRTLNPVIMRGPQNCLYIMSADQMEKMFSLMNIANVPISDFSAQKLLRLFSSGTEEFELDGQHRFILNADMKSYAKIDKNVVIVGMQNRLEVWSEELFEQFVVTSDEIDKAIIAQCENK